MNEVASRAADAKPDGDAAEDIEVLKEPPPILVRTESEERRESRRKRRRKLRRMINSANGLPSFLKLLTANYENSDDEEQEEPVIKVEEPEEPEVPLQTPKRFRIDVDAQLGLKESNSSAITADVMSSSDIARHAGIRTHVVTAREEGWYEGVVSPMEMAEDSVYLPPLQVWIRRHLELFSATAEDAATSQAGRRPIPVGRVGIRCVYCTRARQSGDKDTTATTPDGASSSSVVKNSSLRMNQKQWAVGAVSFPSNVAGLHSICSQKPSLHFEKNCPHIPENERHALVSLLQNQDGRRARGGIPSSLYYTVACRRIGVVDHADGGLRFSRDLALDPLPFATIRHQVEVEEGRTAASKTDASQGVALAGPRIKADDDSERVLAQAVAEEDDMSRYLCLSTDKSFLTDFMFLTLRQMALCHALPTDLTSRGKKTKMLRPGFAGFCCRHCNAKGEASEQSCRSFASAAGNLGSSISNSFSSHLQKCAAVPHRIKKALSAYKRLHPKQMAQLPYGSQRRLIYEFWDRMRSQDKSLEEMQDIIAAMPKPAVHAKPPPNVIASPSGDTNHAEENDEPVSRPDIFPVCQNPETQAVLAKAEEDWDPLTNDGLILPSDRNLVSDFVFLTMRQLKGTMPQEQEGSKRFPGRAGVCCIHCHGKPQQVSPSGRSFPSAPDNFAPALNAGFYNHMQNCVYVPMDMKRALVDTRKIHSTQCSSLKFGSQRKFFGRLFARLGEFRSSVQSLESVDESANQSVVASEETSEAEEEVDVGQYSFLHAPSSEGRPLFMCVECRVVPIQFRAEGAVFYERPSVQSLQKHRKLCQKESFDLGYAATLLKGFLDSHCDGKLGIVDSPSFQSLVGQVVGGNEELRRIFTSDVVAMLQETNVGPPSSPSLATWCHNPLEIDEDKVKAAFEALSNELPKLQGRSLSNCPELIAFLQLISPTFKQIPLLAEDEAMTKSSPGPVVMESLATEIPSQEMEGHSSQKEETDNNRG